jgi:hypothetical protein
MQAPPEQTSPTVQALLSLHGVVLFVNTQPVAGLHESSVQTLPSLHRSGAPGTQTPPLQVSFTVQALPSLHGLLLLMARHPRVVSQKSVVHPFPSSHTSGAPGMQAPPEQTSPTVQALLSLHGAVLFVNTQPVAGLHESFVQTLPSLHRSGAPGTQTPPLQVSFTVQALPSSHGLLLLRARQPSRPSQKSVVHPFPSSHTRGAPGMQAPPAHASPTVQALLSVQALVLFVY